MMSDSTKRIEASTLRSGSVKEQFNLDHAHANCGPGHDTSATEDGQESRGFPPVDSVHRWRNRAPRRFETLLHFKGFFRRCTPKHRNSRRETVGAREHLDFT